MPDQPIVIKKYENRRLYDTRNSRYVNLEDIARLLREGNRVQVVDAASGEDVTRVVLTQIIAESARLPDSTLPLEMLRQMVIASGKATREMFDLYRKTYGTFAASFPAMDRNASVDELRQRIEDLERMIAKKKRNPRPKK